MYCFFCDCFVWIASSLFRVVVALMVCSAGVVGKGQLQIACCWCEVRYANSWLILWVEFFVVVFRSHTSKILNTSFKNCSIQWLYRLVNNVYVYIWSSYKRSIVFLNSMVYTKWKRISMNNFFSFLDFIIIIIIISIIMPPHW